ncbi:MAG: hypothetical protein QOC91_676 [Solirubrobacteraceae bacterium]|nr:hypothetical protein [Solirubrobacteraceae bacterium]
MVHDAVQTGIAPTLRRSLARALCCLALLGAGAVLLSGCGEAGTSHASTFPTHMAGPVTADVGESARSDTCEQWRKGSVQQRHGALKRLRKFATSPIGSSKDRKYGPTLSDSRAYRLFDSLCAKHFARAFKLYKLYERAAAFLGSAPK